MSDTQKISKVDKKVEGNFRSQTRFYVLRVWILLLVLAFVGWWGYEQVMTQMYGRFEILGIKTTDSMVPEGWTGQPQAILVNPSRTEKYLRSLPIDTIWPYGPRLDTWPLTDTLWYAGPINKRSTSDFETWNRFGDKSKQALMIDYWKDLLYQKNIKYKIIEEPELVSENPGYDLMILPGALLLSTVERDAIKKFVGRGGKLMMCWSIGCRDENAEWTGFDFLSQIIGSVPARDVKDTTGGTSMIIKDGSPLTSMVGPGTHLEFYTYNGFVTMDPVEPRARSAATWFSPYWNKQWDDHSNSMIIYGSYLEGKFIWFSFTPETIQDRKDNTDVFSKIVQNGLSWLHGQPLVDISVWPRGYRAGGTMILDARGDALDLAKAVEDASSNGVGLDMMVNTDYAPPRSSGQTFSHDLILSSNSPTQLFGQKLDDQFAWVEAQSKRIKQLTGKAPIGIAPAGWKYDDVTLAASVMNDLQFILGNKLPRYYGPVNKMVKKGGWWIFEKRVQISMVPKAAISAREYYEIKGITVDDDLANAMIGDMNRIADAGGLYLGIVDPSLQSGYGIAKLASKMDSAGVWRASASQVIRRISAWQDLRASTKIITESRIRLNISNEGNLSLRDVPVTVYLTGLFETVKVSSEMVGNVLVSQNWSRDAGEMTFSLAEIKPKENITLFIDVTGSKPTNSQVAGPTGEKAPEQKNNKVTTGK